MIRRALNAIQTDPPHRIRRLKGANPINRFANDKLSGLKPETFHHRITR
jgi:hypothetical protein